MVDTITDFVVQAGLFVTGALSIFFVARKSKWGFVFGLISQPFWYVSAWMGELWGLMILNLALRVLQLVDKAEKEKMMRRPDLASAPLRTPKGT